MVSPPRHVTLMQNRWHHIAVSGWPLIPERSRTEAEFQRLRPWAGLGDSLVNRCEARRRHLRAQFAAIRNRTLFGVNQLTLIRHHSILETH